MGSLWLSCAKVHGPSELWFGVVRGVGRGIGALNARGREVLRVFILDFHYWISHWVVDGEMFMICL